MVRQRRLAGLRGWTGRIRTRAMAIVALMFTVLVVLAGGALLIDREQDGIIQDLAVSDRAATDAVDEFATVVARMGGAFASAVAGVDPAPTVARRILRNSEIATQAYGRLLAVYDGRIDPLLLGGARDVMQGLPDFARQVHDALQQNARDRFIALHAAWIDQSVPLDRLAAEARRIGHQDADRNLARAVAVSGWSQRMTLAGFGFGLVGLGLTWLVLVRLTARPLGRVAAAMERLARGEVETPVPDAARADQVGEMARAVLVFRDNLRGTMRLVEQALEGARRTAVSTEQASGAIGQVSEGSMTQLGELQQVAEALSQSTGAIGEVNGAIQDSHDRMERAKALLAESLEKVQNLIMLVDAVSDDTERVTRIAGTIGKLATQTNILAINAAIEAARAGEHGRGLAVVAEEVRSLAVSSEGLAQEISEVVLLAGRRSRQGSGTAAAVGAAMDELETLVNDSARLSGATAIAMEQQQAMVAQINQRVAVLTRIGQSNATAAEEITVTMIDLARLAADTRSAVEDVAGRRRG